MKIYMSEVEMLRDYVKELRNKQQSSERDLKLLIEIAANRVMRLGRDSASREEFIAAVMSEWRAAIAERDGAK